MAKKTPTTTLPANAQEVVNNWPPTGGQSLEVGPWTNWTNLAIKHGYPTPWDLIRFNFGTVKPAEINWYLKNLIKCDLVTKDGKNYRFGRQNGTDVDPVTIYIPQTDWSMEAGSAHPVDRPPMDEADMNLAVRVRNVLADPRVAGINFVLSGRMFGWKLFDNVRRLIESGAIAVYTKSSNLKKHPSWYDDGTNSFHISPAKTLEVDASIIHEAVHAGLDYEKARDIRIMDSEAAAYVSQMWYQIKRTGFNGARIGDEDPATDKIFDAAYELASELQAGRPPGNPDYFNLRAAIVVHDEYQNAFDWCMYDGVYE